MLTGGRVILGSAQDLGVKQRDVALLICCSELRLRSFDGCGSTSMIETRLAPCILVGCESTSLWNETRLPARASMMSSWASSMARIRTRRRYTKLLSRLLC